MNLADFNDKSWKVSLGLVVKLLHTAVVPGLNICLPTIVTEGFNSWRRMPELEQPTLNYARVSLSLSHSSFQIDLWLIIKIEVYRETVMQHQTV
jgi:hypothetical protein